MNSQQISGCAKWQVAAQATPEKRIAIRSVDPGMTEYNDPVDSADTPADKLFRPFGRLPSTAAWKEFMRSYHPFLTAAAIRVSRRWGKGTTDEIDDIVQEIYIKLCSDGSRILTDFEAARLGQEFGYLKVVATNHGHDYYRRRSASKRDRGRARLEDNRGVAVVDIGIERRLLPKARKLYWLRRRPRPGDATGEFVGPRRKTTLVDVIVRRMKMNAILSRRSTA